VQERKVGHTHARVVRAAGWAFTLSDRHAKLLAESYVELRLLEQLRNSLSNTLHTSGEVSIKGCRRLVANTANHNSPTNGVIYSAVQCHATMSEQLRDVVTCC
jgi:hypothetical protein